MGRFLPTLTGGGVSRSEERQFFRARDMPFKLRSPRSTSHPPGEANPGPHIDTVPAQTVSDGNNHDSASRRRCSNRAISRYPAERWVGIRTDWIGAKAK